MEDTLISQMKENGKYTVFMGDDMWVEFAEGDFNESYGFVPYTNNDYDSVE